MAMTSSGTGARAQPFDAATWLDRACWIVSSRVAFWLTVAIAASIFWLAPRPAMSDLPQHAAQVALWKDLLTGSSAWADLFRINLLTPYLIGYAGALGLAFVMPVLMAFKVMLSLSFLGFIASLVQLRRDVQGDARLDYLFIPGFFGFAYDWGFYSFLVAAPFGLQFIRVAWRYALQPTLMCGVGLAALGVCLVFAHGLMFLFAGLIGGALLVVRARGPLAFLRATWPYAALALLCLAYFWLSRSLEAPADTSRVVWQLDPFLRLIGGLIFIQSNSAGQMAPVTLLLLLAATRREGFRLTAGLVPLAVLLLIMAVVPSIGYGTDYLYERFALFVLPFLALALAVPAGAAESQSAKAWSVVIALCCWLSVGAKIEKTIAFAAENADFENVLSAAEPGRRAASGSLIVNEGSVAARNRTLAKYQPVWYMIDKGGLVEFNFSYYHPQVVRYRTDKVPRSGFGFQPEAGPFDWALPQAVLWDYYFVRKDGADWPAELIRSPRCALRLVKASGPWGLFERGACQP
jgi:hypothetical protein